jgi:carbon-monoxide dehydrogenase large subunit
LFELAARQPEARILASGETTAGGPSWPNACHVCEVEIDPDTGAVAVGGGVAPQPLGRRLVRRWMGGACPRIGSSAAGALCGRPVCVCYDAGGT